MYSWMFDQIIDMKTRNMKTTKLGMATIQKKAKSWSKPLPLAKFWPKYPEMNVRGAKKTVTTAYRWKGQQMHKACESPIIPISS
jgi:hypothetical protein